MTDVGTSISTVVAPLERQRVGDMAIDRFAGLTFSEYREAVEFAKLAAQSKHSIPAYLKGNPGDCLAIITQALRWRLEPYWCMQHSYIAKSESLIAYDSAVHAAIIISTARLKARPRYEYSGEGEERRCTVSATFAGEATPHSYTTPPLGKCRPPKNADGVVKGSPLWMKDEDQALGYYAIRNWGRRYCPDILGGVYDRDEFEETTQDETDIIPPSPNLMERLPGRVGETGFNANVVTAGIEDRQPRRAHRKPQDAPLPAGEPTPPTAGDAAPAPSASPPDGSGQASDGQEAGGAGVGVSEEAAADAILPKTAEQYEVYALAWVSQCSDRDYAQERFRSERDLREACGVRVKVSEKVRKAIEQIGA